MTGTKPIKMSANVVSANSRPTSLQPSVSRRRMSSIARQASACDTCRSRCGLKTRSCPRSITQSMSVAGRRLPVASMPPGSRSNDFPAWVSRIVPSLAVMRPGRCRPAQMPIGSSSGPSGSNTATRPPITSPVMRAAAGMTLPPELADVRLGTGEYFFVYAMSKSLLWVCACSMRMHGLRRQSVCTCHAIPRWRDVPKHVGILLSRDMAHVTL